MISVLLWNLIFNAQTPWLLFKVLIHKVTCFKNPNRHGNEVETLFMHSLHQTQTCILYQIKYLLTGWNFIRHEVNFITTKKKSGKKKGGKQLIADKHRF